MSITYSVQAAIVNESASSFERLAAKITQVNKNCAENYIKTYPALTHPRNLNRFQSLKEDLDSYRKENFLGLSFTSYGFISFIQFTSTFHLFKLEKDDRVILYLEDGEQLEFIFKTPATTSGMLIKNIQPIKDEELEKLASGSLAYWKITNKRQNLELIGGFEFNETNKQYKSPRVGQKLFRLMAENILKIKDELL